MLPPMINSFSSVLSSGSSFGELYAWGFNKQERAFTVNVYGTASEVQLQSVHSYFPYTSRLYKSIFLWCLKSH